MTSGLVKTLKALCDRSDHPFTFDEIVQDAGGEEKKTLSALAYLKERGLIQKARRGVKWRLGDRTLPAIENMLSIYGRVNKSPPRSILRGILALRPFTLPGFLKIARDVGFTRNQGLEFLKTENQRGYLKECFVLFLGLQITQIKSFRFSARVRFVELGEFRSFKFQCSEKGLNFAEERFFVGHYPPAVAGGFKGYLEENTCHLGTEDSSAWIFMGEFRKGILNRSENPVHGVCS
jgi:hypothetical protein